MKYPEASQCLTVPYSACFTGPFHSNSPFHLSTTSAHLCAQHSSSSTRITRIISHSECLADLRPSFASIAMMAKPMASPQPDRPSQGGQRKHTIRSGKCLPWGRRNDKRGSRINIRICRETFTIVCLYVSEWNQVRRNNDGMTVSGRYSIKTKTKMNHRPPTSIRRHTRFENGIIFLRLTSCYPAAISNFVLLLTSRMILVPAILPSPTPSREFQSKNKNSGPRRNTRGRTKKNRNNKKN